MSMENQLALQEYFRRLSSAPAASRAMDYLAAQQARRQAAQDEFNRIMLAQQMREKAAQEEMSFRGKQAEKDRSARLALSLADRTAQYLDSLSDRKFKASENDKDRKAQETRARMAAKDYFDRIAEKEKQDILAQWMAKGYTPNKGEDVSDFVVRASREEEARGAERIQRLRGSKDSIAEEIFTLANDLETERTAAANNAAVNAVKNMGTLKPAQIQQLNTVGYQQFVQSLYKSDPQKASELDSIYNTAKDEALQNIKGSPAKLTRLQLLSRNLEDVDRSLSETVRANPRFDVSTFYQKPASEKPQGAVAPSGGGDIDSWLNQVNQEAEKKVASENQSPPEVAAMTESFRNTIKPFTLGQKQSANEAMYEAIGRKYGFPTESPYNFLGNSTVRVPQWKAVKGILDDHPYLFREIENDPEAVRQIYDSALIQATRTPNDIGQYNLPPYRPR